MCVVKAQIKRDEAVAQRAGWIDEAGGGGGPATWGGTKVNKS